MKKSKNNSNFIKVSSKIYLLRLLASIIFFSISQSIYSQNEFITTWETTSNNESITIPTFSGSSYYYDVIWGDGDTTKNVTADATHSYITAGTYVVKITGTFERILFNNGGDKDKIKSIDQWGEIVWGDMSYAFRGCSNLVYKASDAPDFSNTVIMDYMFADCTSFDVVSPGNMSSWDLSNVTSAFRIFNHAVNFNGDITNWNVSSMENMSEMFAYASGFDQDIGGWDVHSATNMSGMFLYDTIFNQDLNTWVVNNVTNTSGMFSFAYKFNGNIASWNVGNVIYTHAMFHHARDFNININSWDVSDVTDMSFMFTNAHHFNQPLNMWNTKVSKVTSMAAMFKQNPVFDQDISGWVLDSITNTSYMFHLAVLFNQDISSWKVDNVTDMKYMFFGAYAFNQDISSWKVDNVTDMFHMFTSAAVFNQDISSWKVDNVTNMSHMFGTALAFNQDISGWNVSSVTNMDTMFTNASAFNINLGAWDPINVTTMSGMLDNSGISNDKYDSLLIAWTNKPLKTGVIFGVNGKEYCLGKSARANMISNFGWTFTGDSEASGCVPGGGGSGDTVFVYTHLNINDNYTFPESDGDVGNVLTSNGNGSVTWQNNKDNVNDADSDPSNELQTISIYGSDLTLSDGGTVTLPTANADNLGNHTATQFLNMDYRFILNVPHPVDDYDAANKDYVDSHEDADADEFNEAISFMTLDPITYQLDIFEGFINMASVDLSPLAISPIADHIIDIDGDTWVEAIDNSDDDYVGITLSGLTYLNFQSDLNANHRIDMLGADNTIIGRDAGFNNIPDFVLQQGVNNTFIGQESGSSNVDGTSNTFIGHFAGRFANSGANTFIGTFSGENTSGGESNTFVGQSSGKFNTEGTGNTFMGKEAGNSNVDGSQNTFIGLGSGGSGNGTENTYLGFQSGFNSTGDGNVFLGASAGTNEMGDDKLYIANSTTSTPLIKGDFVTEVVEINTVLKLSPRPTAPGSPVAGMMYIDSSDSNKLKVYDGTTWNACW